MTDIQCRENMSPTKRSPVNTDPAPAPASATSSISAFTSISPSIPSPDFPQQQQSQLPLPLSSPSQTKQPPPSPQTKPVFGGNSPFRRRSKYDRENNPTAAGAASAASVPGTQTRSPWNRPPPGTRPVKGQSPIVARQERHRSAPTVPIVAPSGQQMQDGGIPLSTASEITPVMSNEPVDPRANFQLNIGNNVFDVASPDQRLNQQSQPGGAATTPGDPASDPIAQALADLKGIGSSSAVSANSISAHGAGTGSAISRVSADQYVGLGTNPTANTSAPMVPPGEAAIRPPPPLTAPGAGAVQRGTPPPAYDSASAAAAAPVMPSQPVRRLDAPQPAFTSAQMQRTTQKYAGRTQGVFNRPLVSGDVSPGGGDPGALRGTSPAPVQGRARRDTSPGLVRSGRVSVSPGPRDAAGYHSRSMNDRHRYQQSMPSNMPPGSNPPRSLSYSPLPHQEPIQQGSRYARHVSPNPAGGPRHSGQPTPSPRAYSNRVSPAVSAGAAGGGGIMRGHSSAHQHSARVSPYSRPATRQSAYYDGRDPSPAAYARPHSSMGMELALSPRVRDGYDEYGAAVPVDEGYGSQRSYAYGSTSDVGPLSRNVAAGAAAGGSARGRLRSRSVMADRSSDGRPVLHYGEFNFVLLFTLWVMKGLRCDVDRVNG